MFRWDVLFGFLGVSTGGVVDAGNDATLLDDETGVNEKRLS
jgi:hypothetical protein